MDGEPVQGKSVAEVSEMILGPESTDVALTLETLASVREQGFDNQVQGKQHTSDMPEALERATPEDSQLVEKPGGGDPCSSADHRSTEPEGEDGSQCVDAGSDSTSGAPLPHSSGSFADGKTIAASVQDCIVLCGTLQRNFEHESSKVSPFAIPTSNAEQPRNGAQSTVGIRLKGCQIESLVVGGPGE